MPLSIKQDASPHPTRKGYWRWRAWLEGPSDELDNVSLVEYYLHHTYRNPVRKIKTRGNRFQLKSAGYGEFQLRVKVIFCNGEERNLTHWIRLDRSEVSTVKSMTPADSPIRGFIFLSYPTVESELARKLTSALKAKGIEVATANTIPAGDNLVEGVIEQIRNANAAVVILSQENLSPWVELEMKTAISNNVPIIPVLYEKTPQRSHLPKLLQDTPYVSIKDIAYPDQAVHSILENVFKKIKE